MAIHDAYLRRTPYELAFPDLEDARARFAAFEAEAREREADVEDDPAAFVMLASVGRALRALRGPDDDADLIRQHGRLLWHAYRLWKAGEEPALLTVHAVRYLLDPGTTLSWEGALPAAAGYAQLPQHLVWIRGGDEGPPESLDGFFWAGTRDGRLLLLMAMGMRSDRPGLSVVPIEGLPLADAPAWTEGTMRPGGRDFASDMPGAELEGLYEVRSAGEAVKMAARALHHLGAVEGERREPAPDPMEGGAPASRLPHRIVDLE